MYNDAHTTISVTEVHIWISPNGKSQKSRGKQRNSSCCPCGKRAALAELLHADKAAIARRTKNLEAKGFLVRQEAPNDRRSQLLYPTGKAEAMKASKAEIEASFYEYLTSVLTDDESETFAALLNKLYTASKTESRAGFPHFIQAQRK
jgi:DNA-binding MarR family transcriptional regulator